MNEPTAPEPQSSAKVIALVDDDRNILTTVSIALQAEGFTTRLYTDGEMDYVYFFGQKRGCTLMAKPR